MFISIINISRLSLWMRITLSFVVHVEIFWCQFWCIYAIFKYFHISTYLLKSSSSSICMFWILLNPWPIKYLIQTITHVLVIRCKNARHIVCKILMIKQNCFICAVHYEWKDKKEKYSIVFVFRKVTLHLLDNKNAKKWT